MSESSAARIARRLVMTGRVQGVGFRPFVFRLAHEHLLDGHVRNLRGDVEVVVCGSTESVATFATEIVSRAPPLARPAIREIAGCEAPADAGFHIAATMRCTWSFATK